MKNLFIGALALLVPGMSFAGAPSCPDLSGKYDCALTYILTFHRDVIVTQSTDAKGVTTYSIRMIGEDSNGPSNIVADNTDRKANALPDIMAKYVRDVTYKAKCDSSGVAFSGNGTLNKSGERADVSGSLKKIDAENVHLSIGFSAPSRSMELPAECARY